MGRAVAVALAREGVACALMGISRERLTESANACANVGTATSQTLPNNVAQAGRYHPRPSIFFLWFAHVRMI